MPSLAAGGAPGARLYAALGTRGNLVFSPVGIATTLRLALLGARGETAAELAAVLGLAGPQQAAGTLREVAALLDRLPGDRLELRAPGTAWVQSGVALRPGFTAAVDGLGAVSVHDADFRRAADAARAEINALIAAQTAGKITGLLPPGAVDATTRLALASAVYLKAAWAYPFPGGATTGGPFHPEPGRAVSTALMRLTARLRYRRADGYQVVELPYVGGRLAMLIVLPDGALGPVEQRLAAGGVTELSGAGAAAEPGRPAGEEVAEGADAGLGLRRVSLVLPRFGMTSALDLVPALEALGARLMFTREADFSGITDAEPLQVGAVAHQAYIDVDERGTEAAAATATAMVRARAVFGDPLVEMVVDRPFLYAITEISGGLPLFLGRVADPSAG